MVLSIEERLWSRVTKTETLADLLRLDVEAERLVAQTRHFAENLTVELDHEAA